MLQSLTIHNIAVIEQLHIDFDRGFSVLTGETGAGKSILLDSLEFVLGRYSQPSKLIREGALNGSVTLVLNPDDHLLESFFEDHGLTFSPPLIMRRIITKEGKSKAFLNDQPISLGFLNQLASLVVEIHGQFDHLLEPPQQLLALDRYAGVVSADMESAYADWKKAKNALKEAQEATEHRESRLEELNFLIKELERLEPQVGEEERLLALKQTQKNIAQIETILNLVETFSAEPCNMEGKLLTLQRYLEKQDMGTLSILKHAAETVLVSLRDMREEAHQIRYTLERTPLSLNQIEERIYTLRHLARKHKVTSDELKSVLDSLKDEERKLKEHSKYIYHTFGEEVKKKEIFFNEAQKIYDLRKKGARTIEGAIEKILASLKLQSAIFLVNFKELPEREWSRKGIHHVEFHISTNPGLPPKPLGETASGGELSRVMLALKSLLKEKNRIPTLIFDEIDTGLGGAVAAAMGEQLGILSENCQVLAITHSPQLAGYADHHFSVEKYVREGKTFTTIRSLDSEQRLEELSRMLAGKVITERARAAAHELLKKKITV